MATFYIGIIIWFLCIVGFVLLGLSYMFEQPPKYGKFILIALAAMVIFGVVAYINVTSDRTATTSLHATEHIIALQDKSGTEGHIYARRGYFSEELYYFYMVDLGNRSKSNKVPANKTYIYETDSDYRVEWWETNHKWFIFKYNEGVTEWHIYAPKGTIEEDFAIDLE